MTGPTDVATTVNQAYLQAGLAWLRHRLVANVGGTDPAGAAEAPHWPGDNATNGTLPALERLGELIGLSRFERQLLLLAAAPELDIAFAAACGAALGDPATAYPTFGLALLTLPDPSWDALAAGGPLRYWRLVDIHQRSGEALLNAPIRADERIVDLIRGLDAPDGRLEEFWSPLRPFLGAPLPPSQDRDVAEAVTLWLRADPADEVPLLQLVGRDATVRAGLAAEVTDRLGLECFELAADRWLADPHHSDLLRIWQRETVLSRAALYVDVAELRPDDLSRLAGLLTLAGPAVIIGGREPWPFTRRPVYVIDAARPTADEQQALWTAALRTRLADDSDGAADTDEHVASDLADRLDLNQVTLRAVVREAPGLGRGDLWRTSLAFTRPRLEAYAQRITGTAEWADLVLPERELDLLHHLVDQVRGRGTVLRQWGLGGSAGGTGVTALFTGQSGTGKTMAAGVIAGALELALYRIDLSSVVSKYIGETERNLSRVFDAAEAGGVLLLFDEADALFGKRSEVKDSHDRYANIEVNHLLQRMEDYRGVAVLTTNQRHASTARSCAGCASSCPSRSRRRTNGARSGRGRSPAACPASRSTSTGSRSCLRPAG